MQIDPEIVAYFKQQELLRKHGPPPIQLIASLKLLDLRRRYPGIMEAAKPPGKEK